MLEPVPITTDPDVDPVEDPVKSSKDPDPSFDEPTFTSPSMALLSTMEPPDTDPAPDIIETLPPVYPTPAETMMELGFTEEDKEADDPDDKITSPLLPLSELPEEKINEPLEAEAPETEPVETFIEPLEDFVDVEEEISIDPEFCKSEAPPEIVTDPLLIEFTEKSPPRKNV
jgi:hypothetical protein